MNLITDRTASDVLLGTAKGRYGFEDLNRVETAVAELCGLAEEVGIYLDLTVKMDWGAPGDFSVGTWPTQQQMARYLNNVQIIRKTLGLPDILPSSMQNLTETQANNIELTLQMAYENILSKMEEETA